MLHASVTEEVKISRVYDNCNTRNFSASTDTGSLEVMKGSLFTSTNDKCTIN
jgi:hypothetical protein